ncbi:hypothetical protein [Kangiella sediminilitoris]|uniref:PsbP C-terminal domain-containing protein n=1 Tax=Kangiella sediminilitoris TaxID=1144748 RepID=A0A1B3B9K2_9GAMM|nr:hypothetical protein [Kangiella sediminilitoris]AOE49481.1 hypothetical protein KS2013_757 [Kangiella sediminilitoris]
MKITNLFLIILLTLLINFPASSETWTISEGLSVTPSENLDVTYQLVDGFGKGSEVVVGWSGEETNYLMEVYKAKAVVNSEEVRRLMAEELRKQYNLTSLVINNGEYGVFETDTSLTVEYWTDIWFINDKQETQLYYLLHTQNVSFLFSVFPAGDACIDEIIESSTKLLKTAKTFEKS